MRQMVCILVFAAVSLTGCFDKTYTTVIQPVAVPDSGMVYFWADSIMHVRVDHIDGTSPVLPFLLTPVTWELPVGPYHAYFETPSMPEAIVVPFVVRGGEVVVVRP